MDRLTTLDLFVRIVDRGSFRAAAADLGVSRPVATAAIKAPEQRLGARLLQRLTRHSKAFSLRASETSIPPNLTFHS